MTRRALLLLLAAIPAAGAEPARLLSLLLAPERELRERGEEEAVTVARADAASLEPLWGDLDLRGRCVLLRALGRSGAKEAIRLALAKAGDPEPELFRALLDGLVRGGAKALFEPLPEATPLARRAAVESLRLRWRVESELVKLKSMSGWTGSYAGQFDEVRAIGREALPILVDIIANRDHPLPGEAGAGPYRGIHPQMHLFDPQELRVVVANNVHALLAPGEGPAIEELLRLCDEYLSMDEAVRPFERTDLGPAIAFSLHDYGVRESLEDPRLFAPARRRMDELRELAYPTFGRQRMVNPSGLWDYGWACIRLGRYDEGEECYKQVLERADSGSRPLAAYNLACSFAMRAAGNPGERARFSRDAVFYLRLAVEAGFVDWPWMEKDRDLDAIRADPGYLSILEGLRREYPDRTERKVEKDIDAILNEGK